MIAIPISISLGIISILPGAFDPSFTATGSFVIRSMLGGIDSFPLLAVPMFVLAGIVMAHGQISKRLFDVFAYFLGKRTAGIPSAVIVTCLFYGAISGSAPATVAAVGSMTIPFLTELGYDRKFSIAIVAVASVFNNTFFLIVFPLFNNHFLYFNILTYVIMYLIGRKTSDTAGGIYFHPIR